MTIPGFFALLVPLGLLAVADVFMARLLEPSLPFPLTLIVIVAVQVAWAVLAFRPKEQS